MTNSGSNLFIAAVIFSTENSENPITWNQIFCYLVTGNVLAHNNPTAS